MEKIILNDPTLCLALELIKRECSKHYHCSHCPMNGSLGCMLSHPDVFPSGLEIEFKGDARC